MNDNIIEASDHPPSIEQILQEQQALTDYLRHQLAPSTLRAYRSDWRVFRHWCLARQKQALPAAPETIALFLSAQADAGIHPSTLERRLAAIRLAHKTSQQNLSTDSELVRATLAGIKRKHGSRSHPKTPALAADVKAMVDCIDVNTLRGKRDRAMLLLGFAGALRRSELVGISLEQLEDVPGRGIRIHLLRSKTDQAGEGQSVAVPRGGYHCPVKAVDTWIQAAVLETGPLFRRISKADNLIVNSHLTAQSVALVVKKYAAEAGLNPEYYAGHSLRSGWATQAALNGKSVFKMREVTRQTLVTLQGYVRLVNAFDDHAGEDML